MSWHLSHQLMGVLVGVLCGDEVKSEPVPDELSSVQTRRAGYGMFSPVVSCAVRTGVNDASYSPGFFEVEGSCAWGEAG